MTTGWDVPPPASIIVVVLLNVTELEAQTAYLMSQRRPLPSNVPEQVLSKLQRMLRDRAENHERIYLFSPSQPEP